METASGGQAGNQPGPGHGSPGQEPLSRLDEPSSVPPPSAKELWWGPALAATVAAVCSLGGMVLAPVAVVLLDFARYEGSFVGGTIIVAFSVGLFLLLTLITGARLQSLGEPQWFRIALLVLAPPPFIGFYIVVYVVMASGISGGLAYFLVALALIWAWAFQIIRWRLTGIRLLPWRLPTAVTGYSLLVALLIWGAQEVQGLLLRQAQPERLEMMVLDHPDWQATRAVTETVEGHESYSQTYTTAREGIADVDLSLVLNPEASQTQVCEAPLAECERRGDLLVEVHRGTQRHIFLDIGDEVVSLRWRGGGGGSEPEQLVELSDHIRPSTPDDHRWLSVLLFRDP
ncbi:hypothetical protein [Nocardiopsis nanhaiensis]